MDKKLSKKHHVLTDLFKICYEKNNFVFDNNLVKTVCAKHGFGNPFDVTKLDDTSKFPQIMLDNDYFLLHLGGGEHQFVKGIENAFHTFEPISSLNVIDWEYKKSILNEFDTSESNILSVANNQGIIHDFLYGNKKMVANVYLPRRTKTSLTHKVSDIEVTTTNVQLEIDMVMECQGIVTVFEGKNKFPDNFAAYQIYYPFLYYLNLKINNHLAIREIDCCYLLRKRVDDMSVIRLYRYTFTNPLNMTSIKLLKSAQYNLIQM